MNEELRPYDGLGGLRHFCLGMRRLGKRASAQVTSVFRSKDLTKRVFLEKLRRVLLFISPSESRRVRKRKDRRRIVGISPTKFKNDERGEKS